MQPPGAPSPPREGDEPPPFLDALARELSRERPDAARARAQSYLARVPAGYTELTSVETAAADLAVVEQLEPGDIRVTLRRDGADPPPLRRVRMIRDGDPLELSAFLPTLEHLGLTVADQVTHRLAAGADGSGGRPVAISDFWVRVDRDLPSGVTLDTERDGPRLGDAILAVLRGATVSDSLDRLVLAAGLHWDDVEVLRAYRSYRRQAGTPFTPAFFSDALVANPAVAAAFVALFAARFDPDRQPDPAAVRTAKEAVLAALGEVDRFDEDRILRGVLSLIDATLRTNRYVPGRRCLALKFHSARVPDLPPPIPAVEVFVAAPCVQGIHLRGGKVARGGLRHSDRREDLRAEVLGLLKAQMIKNALIVPTGAKGGFVIPRTPTAGPVPPDQARIAYATFVGGLLDLSDNVAGGEVVTPPRVRRADGDDAYLVVAADRGTATFSDLANRISLERGFWLGDAFASGGSHGYDHKRMGITARGAWIAVQRHFRQLDTDVQTDPVRVVGIGDMSGDVFGNGMLLSRSLRLVAAFDHRHVFVDPDPDPEVAFAERERLFALPRSSWADYDPAALSAGGGVWSRTQKSIPLSAQVQELLRVTSAELSPPELIRAILRAPVDLLFAGGIGTFVRASTETDTEVGDRANDAVRVTADELGARVVGEGGNLALTQRARIQYARRGGRCNTDSIDNAAGVATSDREVNLKILLSAAIEAGDLDPGQRNEFLESAQQEVAEAVLHDVDRQLAALDWEVPASPALLDSYEELMAELIEAERLDRDVEALPSTAEMGRRREAGAGLTRPELAVLLGYAKVHLAGQLLRSRMPDQPEFTGALRRAFVPSAVARFRHLLGRHRLRRELIATTVANHLVDHMGVTYATRTVYELGCSPHELAAAWWAACEVADAWSAWRQVAALGERTTPALQVEMAEEVDRLVDTLTRSYVRSGGGEDVAATVARDRPAFERLTALPEEVLPRNRRADRAARRERWTDLGIPSEVAAGLASLRELTIAPDVATVAAKTGRDVLEVGETFWRVSAALPIDDVSNRLRRLTLRGSWAYRQRRGLFDELRDLRRAGAVTALRTDADIRTAVHDFLDSRASGLRRVRTLLGALEHDGEAGLDGAAVVIRALRDALVTPRPGSGR